MENDDYWNWYLKPHQLDIMILHQDGKYFDELLKIYDVKLFKKNEVNYSGYNIGGHIDWEFHSLFSEIYFFCFDNYSDELISEMLLRSQIIEDKEVYIWCDDYQPIYLMEPKKYCKIWELFDWSTGNQGYTALSYSGRFWEFIEHSKYGNHMLFSNYKIQYGNYITVL